MRNLFENRFVKIVFLIFALGLAIPGVLLIKDSKGDWQTILIGALMVLPFFVLWAYLKSTDKEIDEIKKNFKEMSGKDTDPS